MTFEFDEAGRETTRRIGETLTIDHAYDDQGRLTDQRVRVAGDRTVQHRVYGYRPDGHLTRIDDHLAGRRRFDLTREGRVTGVTAANWSERYAYDESGNQTEASWPADDSAAGPRTYVGTRLTGAGSVRYEHDAQGRVVLRQKRRLSRKPDTWRYGWDAESGQVSAERPERPRVPRPDQTTGSRGPHIQRVRLLSAGGRRSGIDDQCHERGQRSRHDVVDHS
ncbi:hypothetical protein [Streptomyces virginiae]|uniref:hypothetical protein n=1 Tax=Streptomyces virginiae TaxID=1961 RepID=UPI002B1E08A8|nr:hypothetical protein [Streptomyces virginiae]